ncbi:hypothetical protein [Streptomyces sp. MA15]|uniref:hypothetical protein n=1 Tax=Streptomyces sp. MA15 TaxID=3055061 RepID=UPI0025B1950A|nr:hypothetical protein [Streptomyces sp. MA15]MDN3268813.1 hypothetical protein [Streptomyces sp. MA15]
MRRTARALSVAAVAGTVLGALAPAASAVTVPGSAGAWASPSPCASPAGGHGWQGHASRSAAPSPAGADTHEAGESGAGTLVEEFTEADLYGAESLDASEGLMPGEAGEADPLASEPAEEPPAALDPAGSGDTAWEELIPDADAEAEAEERAGTQGAEGAPGAVATAADPGAADPDATDPYATDPHGADPYAADTGTTDHKAPPRTAVEPEATGPEADPFRTAPPRPTTSPTASHKPAPGHPTHNPPPTHEPTTTPCPSPTAHQGVQAGGGGAFTDSVPAQVAGGLLIAGAFGAAAHRLHRRRTGRARG